MQLGSVIGDSLASVLFLLSPLEQASSLRLSVKTDTELSCVSGLFSVNTRTWFSVEEGIVVLH